MSISALRHSFAAAALAMLAACSTVPAAGSTDSGSSRMIADGTTFAMQPGTSVLLADASTLRYVRVVNDSRCPPDVQCVWAGDAEIAFQWRAPAATRAQAFSLHTTVGDKSATVGQRRLSLLSLARGDAPGAQLQVDPMR